MIASSRQNSRMYTHTAENVLNTVHTAENVLNTVHTAENVWNTVHTAENVWNTVHTAENVPSGFKLKLLNFFFGLCLYAGYWAIFSIFRKCHLGNFEQIMF